MDRKPYANNSRKPYKSFYAFSMNHKDLGFLSNKLDFRNQ